METTPVALFIFNRPETTARTFAAISAARPSKLLLVADGPRPSVSTDELNCQAARAIVEHVNWPCVVERHFSDVNLGLRSRMSSGLDWVFQRVDRAIILEDDCIPHPSFFNYCGELLQKYHDDTRIISISGDNYQEGNWRGDGTYYFSKYPTCWGWASWRRAWNMFDLSMSKWPQFRDSGALKSACSDPVEYQYWHSCFERTFAGENNSWAYAWVFAAFANYCLSPHPNQNLISNIGFGSGGTHTTADSPLANLPTFDIGKTRHPSYVAPHFDADLFEFDWTHGGSELRKRLSHASVSQPTLAGRARRWLGRAKRRGIAYLQSVAHCGR